ncbi:MAG TPA: hypothetical protein VK636_13370, partial [Gemmatimonadaceae bacterium]|nr:hypothetical protein [Gemmatimonadaceae bacterium]
VRSVFINYEDARWVRGMNRLRHAYLQMVPDLEPFFVTGHEPSDDRKALAHGAPQHSANIAMSLTTTSSVVAALNSLLAGALASDLGALAGWRIALDVAIGAGVSLVSGAVHVRYAAQFRRRHTAS